MHLPQLLPGIPIPNDKPNGTAVFRWSCGRASRDSAVVLAIETSISFITDLSRNETNPRLFGPALMFPIVLIPSIIFQCNENNLDKTDTTLDC